MAAPRVLLINPWIYDFAAFDFWAKPLGLLHIGESLRRKGIDVALIDCVGPSDGKRFGTGHFRKQEIPKPKILQGIPRRYSRYGISEEEFLRQLDSTRGFDAVLVTARMTYWYPGAFRAIQLVRHKLPGPPIILGGVYATLCPDHAARFSGADHVHHGPASADLFRLLAQYMPLPVTGDEDPVIDCHPAIDLLAAPRYGVFTTSEGCPFDCTYCASHLLAPRFRQKSVEACFQDILWMNRTLGLKDIAFYDDALLTSASSHFIPLMDQVCRSRLDVRFHCPNGLHLREINTEVAGRLRQSGFKTIRLGLETATSGSERTIDNKASCEELVHAVSALRSAGYESHEIGVYLMAGLPGQSREEVEESMRKVKEAGARPYLSEYSPIPRTALWEAARKASPYPIEEEPLFQNPSLSPCAPEGFTIERYRWRKSIVGRDPR
ncbi:MAG: radical SAM protein [Dehalococcoidia bacterium]|nr:radical SAM protein [Dehalococcoidia bacterium]